MKPKRTPSRVREITRDTVPIVRLAVADDEKRVSAINATGLQRLPNTGLRFSANARTPSR